MRRKPSEITASLLMLAVMIFGGYVLVLWGLHSMIDGLMTNTVTRLVALSISVVANVKLCYMAAGGGKS